MTTTMYYSIIVIQMTNVKIPTTMKKKPPLINVIEDDYTAGIIHQSVRKLKLIQNRQQFEEDDDFATRLLVGGSTLVGTPSRSNKANPSIIAADLQ